MSKEWEIFSSCDGYRNNIANVWFYVFTVIFSFVSIPYSYIKLCTCPNNRVP